MKQKLMYIGLICFGLLQGACAWASSYMPFSLNQPLHNTTSVAQFNIEHPFRCEVKEFGDQDISTTISVRPQDFKLTQFTPSDALPRFEVNGFSFNSLPVDEAIQTLVEEADITVYTEGGVYPEMSAQDVYGELSKVLDEITETGGVFYTYDAAQKTLKLSKAERFQLNLPKNNTVMLAVLDAIRGANIKTAEPDWHQFSIVLTLYPEQKKIVDELLNKMLRESKLLALDVAVYQLDAQLQNGVRWQDIVDNFGAGRIHSEKSGLMGKALTMGHNKKAAGLLRALGQIYNIRKVSQGIAVVPHTWKMRFDVGRCALQQQDLNSLSFLLNADIQSSDMIETNITLDTLAGEISAFTTVSGLDDEIVIIGVPTQMVQPSQTGELLMTLKIKLIRLVSGEK